MSTQERVGSSDIGGASGSVPQDMVSVKIPSRVKGEQPYVWLPRSITEKLGDLFTLEYVQPGLFRMRPTRFGKVLSWDAIQAVATSLKPLTTTRGGGFTFTWE